MNKTPKSKEFDYKSNADFCDELREPANDFSKRWNISATVAYNAFLEAAKIGHDLAHKGLHL